MSDICEACGFDECDGACTAYHQHIINLRDAQIERMNVVNQEQAEKVTKLTDLLSQIDYLVVECHSIQVNSPIHREINKALRGKP